MKDYVEYEINRKISNKTLILDYLIKLDIPGFKKENNKTYVLSPIEQDSKTWFNEFCVFVFKNLGKKFVPIIRLSDGEYEFLLGNKAPVYDQKYFSFFKNYIIFLYKKVFKKNSFSARTLPSVSSGNYSIQEINNIIPSIEKNLKFLSKHGIFAFHLTYGEKQFQERFHYPLKLYLDSLKININSKNYFPFYFVYAILMGPFSEKLFKNRNILVVHSATGNKKKIISDTLFKKGVRKITWETISSSKSLSDKIIVEKSLKLDFVLIGAGVGKLNQIISLSTLKVPLIDAGFCFEVWANKSNSSLRPMMISN